MKPIIYGHTTTIDYKYKRILEGLDVEYRCVTAYSWVRVWWNIRKDEKAVFHFRYLQWRGYIGTALLYGMILITCKLKRIPLLWNCHNILEHRHFSRTYNNLLRRIITRWVDRIIVFHEDLKAYLHPHEDKVRVCNFGEFRSLLLEKAHKENEGFKRRYQSWLGRRSITGPDIVFVGDYSEWKQVELLIEFLRCNSHVHGLIVSRWLPENCQCGDNVLVHRRDRVFAELLPILETSRAIGYMGHRNISVPAAVHLFPSFGIPVVAYDVAPVNTMVTKAGMGELFETTGELAEAYERVREDYEKYSMAAGAFSRRNSWEKAAEVHRNVLRELLDDV